MKKTILTTIFSALMMMPFALRAQYNRVSLDLEGGVTRPMDPLTKGYYTNLATPFHFKGGVRIMAVPSFGIKLSYSLDQFKNSSGSPTFVSNAHVIDMEGIVNIGRACHFEGFSKHIGLFAHAGTGLGYLIGTNLAGTKGKDRVGNFQFGFTSIFKVAERLGLTADISMYGNTRQNRTFDFKSPTTNTKGFDAYYANISIGASISIGKNKKSMDWKFSDNGSNDMVDSLAMELAELKRSNEKMKTSVNEISENMKDDDNDGVANYLDQEPKTPAGVIVDTKGREVIFPNFENLIGNNDSDNSLFYTVQLGVFSKSIPEKYWRNITPIYVLKIEDGTRRYYHDIFHSVADATPALQRAKLSGIQDAFISAYYKGKRITIAEADRILSAEGPKVLRPKP